MAQDRGPPLDDQRQQRVAPSHPQKPSPSRRPPSSPTTAAGRADLRGGFQRGAIAGWRAALPCAARSRPAGPPWRGSQGAPRAPWPGAWGSETPGIILTSEVSPRSALRKTKAPPAQQPRRTGAQQPHRTGAKTAKPNRRKAAKPTRRKNRRHTRPTANSSGPAQRQRPPKKKRCARHIARRPQAGRSAAERARRGPGPRRTPPATRARGRPAGARPAPAPGPR